MKKYPFLRAQFIASAFQEDQFPKTATAREEAMTEIAIVGRSNVGKSSLINSLFKGPKLAKASSTPGKTQSINFFIVDEQLALVDLPGYGYAKVSKEMKEKWSALIEAYLHSRKSLSLILFLIDSRREFHRRGIIAFFGNGRRNMGASPYCSFSQNQIRSPHTKRKNRFLSA